MTQPFFILEWRTLTRKLRSEKGAKTQHAGRSAKSSQ